MEQGRHPVRPAGPKAGDALPGHRPSAGRGKQEVGPRLRRAGPSPCRPSGYHVAPLSLALEPHILSGHPLHYSSFSPSEDMAGNGGPMVT